MGDPAAVKSRIKHLQSVAITTICAIVSPSGVPSGSALGPKRNLASVVAKKLLQSSYEKHLSVLLQSINSHGLFVSVLKVLYELCEVSRDMAVHVRSQPRVITPLLAHLKASVQKDDRSEETQLVLRLLCLFLSGGGEYSPE